MRNLSYVIILLLSVVLTEGAKGADLTSEQLRFRSSVEKFLREEGFSPNIDSDNSLTFKKEGELYWIDIAENSPFYIEFHRMGLGTKNAQKADVILAANETTKKTKCAKAIVNENSVSIVIEMFCHSPEEFRYVFYRSLKALDTAYTNLQNAYSDITN